MGETSIPATDCPIAKRYGDHAYYTLRTRPWWNKFRLVLVLTCSHCDLEIMDPTRQQASMWALAIFITIVVVVTGLTLGVLIAVLF